MPHSSLQPRPGVEPGTPFCDLPLMLVQGAFFFMAGPLCPTALLMALGPDSPIRDFPPPQQVLMTVSPYEALINLRGRWLGGDQGLWPYADEDYSSISCGGEGTPQTFLPAIKATWLSIVALGKVKKRSPLRKEISYVLYAWHEIKMGYNEVENSWSFMLPLMATESSRPSGHDPSCSLGRAVGGSAQWWKAQ